MKIAIHPLDNTNYDSAVEILQQGGLVAFPTETVYGLGADASNPKAVEKVFAAKGRPSDHPLIVHVADSQMAANWVKEIPEIAQKFMNTFWPGPLTLILPKADHVSTLVTGGQDTVAIRCPNHPVAQGLIRAFGGALVAPSANKYTRISPTTAQHVQNSFTVEEVQYILDGGACAIGLESTIIDLTDVVPTVVRLGQIDASEVSQKLRISLLTAPAQAREQKKVSGSALAHYAPYAKLFLLDEAGIIQYIKQASEEEKIGVWMKDVSGLQNKANVFGLQTPETAELYAQQLYAVLHTMDEQEVDTILFEVPKIGLEWMAIHDRLQRAAAGSGH